MAKPLGLRRCTASCLRVIPFAVRKSRRSRAAGNSHYGLIVCEFRSRALGPCPRPPPLVSQETHSCPEKENPNTWKAVLRAEPL
ncbi:hypothetical protein SKAU_G00266900 [Synaphobranchus kaupii]|uniref:Uncharacterized protein n=1 Tax=Synaphobranchus kaupii TaxID=118154 RepID=A0A9Q1EZT3_SYNKA|nr:hypothetical protein SKAU_G00266900 [Synaphobranchus kaupii]